MAGSKLKISLHRGYVAERRTTLYTNAKRSSWRNTPNMSTWHIGGRLLPTVLGRLIGETREASCAVEASHGLVAP